MEEALYRWLYSDIDDLIDFDGYYEPKKESNIEVVI